MYIHLKKNIHISFFDLINSEMDTRNLIKVFSFSLNNQQSKAVSTTLGWTVHVLLCHCHARIQAAAHDSCFVPWAATVSNALRSAAKFFAICFIFSLVCLWVVFLVVIGLLVMFSW